MMRYGLNMIGGAMLAALAATAPAWAQDLVRGGAPLPQFKLSFPGLDAATAPSDNLEIALTAPNKSVFSFLFSPRAQEGTSYDEITGAAHNSAGINWNVFALNRFYGGFGLSGSIISPGSDDPLHRALSGSPATVHGTLHFGYNLGDQQSLMLSYDHAQTPLFSNDHGELGENLRFGYGFRF